MPENDRPEFDPDIVKRFLGQLNKKPLPREYPHGRISGEDDGALAIAVGADTKTGTVIVNFGKEVSWIGLNPADVAVLVQALVKRAREVAKEPFTVELG